MVVLFTQLSDNGMMECALLYLKRQLCESLLSLVPWLPAHPARSGSAFCELERDNAGVHRVLRLRLAAGPAALDAQAIPCVALWFGFCTCSLVLLHCSRAQPDSARAQRESGAFAALRLCVATVGAVHYRRAHWHRLLDGARLLGDREQTCAAARARPGAGLACGPQGAHSVRFALVHSSSHKCTVVFAEGWVR